MTGPVLSIYALALAATMIFYMAPTPVPFLLAEQGIDPFSSESSSPAAR